MFLLHSSHNLNFLHQIPCKFGCFSFNCPLSLNAIMELCRKLSLLSRDVLMSIPVDSRNLGNYRRSLSDPGVTTEWLHQIFQEPNTDRLLCSS